MKKIVIVEILLFIGLCLSILAYSADTVVDPTDNVKTVNSSGVETGTALTPYNVRTTTATTFSTGWVTVLNTATLIKAANASRASIALRNIGSVDAYIGSYSTIATSSGFPIKANESLTLDRNTSAIYGVVVSDATNIIYLEE